MAKAKKPATGKTAATPSETETSASAKTAAETASATDKGTDSATKSDNAGSKKPDTAAKSETPKSGAPAKAASAAGAKTTPKKETTPKSSASVQASSATASKTTTSAAKKDVDAKAASAPATGTAKEAEKPAAPAKKDSSEPASKPAPATATAASAAAPSSPAPEPKRSIFWPLVMGGVVAGGIGFAISEANLFQQRSDQAGLEQRLEAQGAAIEDLRAAMSEPAPADPVDLSAVEGQLATLDERLSGIASDLEGFGERITELEARPLTTVGSPDEANQAYEEALASLRSSLADQQAEIENQRGEIADLIANARSVEEATADAARAAAAQNALAQIGAALTSGAAFQEEIGALEEAGLTDVPTNLTEVAETGTVTLANLQARFPDLAREALSAARQSGAQSGDDGFGGFLRRQLGARSVTPREGNDPDAILSRAEAALRNGSLATALEEVAALPEEAKEPLSAWISDATALAQARQAVQDLSQSLTAN